MNGPAPEPRLLHHHLDRAVGRWPEAVAIDVPPGPSRPARQTWTYAELDRRTRVLAGHVASRIEAQDVVAILLPRTSPWLVAAEIAVLRAGGAWMAIDPMAPPAHQAHVLRDVGAQLVLADAAGCQRARAAGVAAEACLDVDAVGEAPLPAGPAAASGVPEVGPDALAYVIYTSGSTGRPKGVLLEHAGIVNLVASDLERFGLGPGDRVAQGSSHAYDSSVEEVWLALAAGATLVVMDDEVVRLGPDLVPWLAAEHVTVLCPPPTLLRMTGCADPRVALPDLRLVYVGGEALERDVVDRWAPGRWLENGYGPTECTVTVLRTRVREGGPIPIGRPVPGHRAWVLDPALEEVADGATGELCIGGVGLARGYHRLPALTAERFPVHPRLGRIYRTGDRVRRDETGDLHFLGRLDDQVKLRGHRVELGAIDAALASCAGVREAACRVQGEGERALLAAWLVPTDPAAPPAWSAIAAHLRTLVPEGMVPARHAFLGSLPRLTSGKLDRRSLPSIDAPAAEVAGPEIAPRDPVEARIAAAAGEVLGLEAVSVEADFFLALGGDSVGAARLVSALRDDPATAALAVRDVYEARTVAGLAERARSAAPVDGGAAAGSRAGGRPALFTACQALALAASLAIAAPVVWLVWFLVVPWWLRLVGLVGAMVLTPVVLLLVAMLWAPVGVGLAVLAKRLLIGRYTPRRAPAFGGFHLRHWLMERFAGLVPWGLLADTVFLSAALRALGATIGARVHVHRGVDVTRGGWDLLSIGDEATIGQDAALRVLALDDGQLVVGPVHVGAGAVVETRAGMDAHTRLGDDACLGALSWLETGRSVGAGRRARGVPAVEVGAAPAAPTEGAARGMDPRLHGALTILSRFGRAMALYLLAFVLPAAVALAVAGISTERFLGWLYHPQADPVGPLAVVAFTVGAIVLATVLSALATRWVGRVPTGRHPRWGWTWLVLLAKRDALAAAGRLLSGTLLWPRWLRLAGMRIGRDCEISSIVDVVPETVTIGEGSFLADGIYLGGPRIRRGVVEIEHTRLGERTFLGNHVVVPTGARLPDDLLLGSATVAAEAPFAPGTAFFGHPAFELPRREVVAADRRLTHEPGPLRRANRWLWELLRFALPVAPLLVFFAWLGVLEAARASLGTVPWVLGAVPLATLGAAVLLVLLVVLLKWGLLGRVRPAQHPLWSCWCSRWDFLYVAWGAWCRPILAALEGTLLLAPALRLFGARIGRRVLLGRGFAQLVDPDMIEIGDDATASPLYQAHSFEDRVLKVDRVTIGPRATVGPGAILFYGARLPEGTWVAPQSVVMKHEHLKAGVAYEGAPAGWRRRGP